LPAESNNSGAFFSLGSHDINITNILQNDIESFYTHTRYLIVLATHLKPIIMEILQARIFTIDYSYRSISRSLQSHARCSIVTSFFHLSFRLIENTVSAQSTMLTGRYLEVYYNLMLDARSLSLSSTSAFASERTLSQHNRLCLQVDISKFTISCWMLDR
jgi:hypothetical protein